MASTFTSILRLELMGTGDQSDTWGTTLDNQLTLLENAIAKNQPIVTTGGTTTLSASNGADDQSRSLCLDLSGALASNAIVVVPSKSKMYLARNSTTGAFSVTVKTAAGTGVTLQQDGYTAVLYCDGVNVVNVGEVVFPQSAAELAASITPAQTKYNYGDVRRYNAIGDGSFDCSSAFQNAGLSNRRCTVPEGTWKINEVLVTVDNVRFEGTGLSSILKIGATNARLFNVTAQGFGVRASQWQGDGTSSNSTNGVGVFLNGAGGAVFEDNFSTGFGFGAVSGVAATPLTGPKIIRHKTRLTGAGGNEFYLGGLWVQTVIEDPDCYSTTADRCLLMYDNSTTGPTNLRVRGGTSRGYTKQQWATADENWDGSDRNWDFVFDGLNCNQSNWSAIKCKTSKGVKIINCTFDGCGLAQEDAANGLYGDVLCNSLGNIMIAHNIFRNSGSAAIRCNTALVSQYPGSNPGGQAISMWTIDHNQIFTVGVAFPANGYGILIADGMKNMLVNGNSMRGITTTGFMCVQTSLIPFFDLTLTDNTVQDSIGMTGAGISVAWGQNLRMDGNLVQNFGTVGVQLDNIIDIQIGPTDTVLDAGTTGGYGYQIGNFQNLNFKARAGNSTFPQWVTLTGNTVGQRVFNGTHVYECVIGGTTGATGPTHTAGAAVDGTVTWYYIGNYQQLPYAVRIVGSANGKMNLDFDPAGCTTGPIANLVLGSGGTRIHYTTNIATVNATVTNAQVIPIPDTTAWYCEMRVLAQDSTTPNRAAFGQAGLFYRAGGATAREGALSPMITTIASAGAAAWLAVPAASGNNLAPAQVTGAAGKNINWAVDVTLLGMP